MRRRFELLRSVPTGREVVRPPDGSGVAAEQGLVVAVAPIIKRRNSLPVALSGFFDATLDLASKQRA